MNKKIVVVTDISLTNKATGMAQTLANLFDNYPADRILFCTPKRSSGKFKDIRSIQYNPILFRSRLFNRIDSRAFIKHFFKKIKLPIVVNKILRFNPDLVIISNLAYNSSLIVISLLEKRKIPLCVYLMDHISVEDKSAFNLLFVPLMNKAEKHIFISTYMAQMYLLSYSNIKNWIVVHNPVDEREIALSPLVHRNNSELTIAYAGSLWPMHMDAIILFAKAMVELRKQDIKVKLVIYTADHFFNLNKKLFSELDITYAGFYRFDQLKPHLMQHDALLVASSFEKKYHDLSAYSIQTKVTDYLACGLPLVAIGPSYSACNKFITENDCGFTISTSSVLSIAEQMKDYLNKSSASIKAKTIKGLALIESSYKKHLVQKKLYRFLSA